ncbi:unnamed protein product [Acanthoscelides obtectus]|uniref:DUF4817 domain-containing protein n=1 Tax=Acanthoscelides obtectus TaxID=200917 RepID=A0A9P0NW92_ACAOB|nr:unnamed protein product [Acanthoscelides obtectus]CAK1672963.1 Transposable element Tc3 transposase [Acanthoscelides obtectus]
MESYSIEDRIKVIQEHYKNGAKIKNTFRALREHFGRNNRPNETTIELRGADHFSRRTFSDWLLEHRQIDANFSPKIMFSDEAHFTLNGTVNNQNCRIWANENPREYQEQPMHPQKVHHRTFFFENAAGDAVTVNSERYHVMIEDYFLPQLEGMDMDDVYFQQDGATCHTTNVNIHRLQPFFGDRVISRRGNVPWPPRSCDLTPLDFFLWGYLKSKVYVNKPATLQELKSNIIAEINAIEPTMLQNVIENFDHRMDSYSLNRNYQISNI